MIHSNRWLTRLIGRPALLLVITATCGVILLPDGMTAEPERSEKALSAKSAPILNYEELVKAGWKISRPPYPATAVPKHENGTVYLKVTTNAEGKVVQAVPAKKEVNLSESENAMASFVRGNWHGPPNTTVTTFQHFSR